MNTFPFTFFLILKTILQLFDVWNIGNKHGFRSSSDLVPLLLDSFTLPCWESCSLPRPSFFISQTRNLLRRWNFFLFWIKKFFFQIRPFFFLLLGTSLPFLILDFFQYYWASFPLKPRLNQGSRHHF